MDSHSRRLDIKPNQMPHCFGAESKDENRKITAHGVLGKSKLKVLTEVLTAILTEILTVEIAKLLIKFFCTTDHHVR